MTFISNGNTVSATLMQAAALTSGTADELNSLKDGATTYNDNTNIGSTTADIFDIVAVTSSEWVVGAAKLNANLKVGQNAAVDWTNPRSVLTICGA